MRLLINADDLGLSLAVNDAIFRAYDNGLLRSCSLLAYGPAFDDAARRLRERPDLGVGAHLDTTEFSRAPWLTQIARIRDAGIVPDHIDSHQHMHLRWSALPALRRVVTLSGIHAIRSRSTAYGPAVLSRIWRGCITFAAMPDQFYAMDHFLACGKPVHPGVVEVMVHPGNPAHPRYADEMLALARLGHSPLRFAESVARPPKAMA